VDKRKRGEGENMLGDRLQDNISARAETRGFSEQQADSQDAGRLSNATMPPVGTYPAGLLPPLQDACERFLGPVTCKICNKRISHAETGTCALARTGACVQMMILLLLFLQKQSLVFAVYLFGIGTLHTGPGLKKKAHVIMLSP
jgi:hypothetical protein